MRPQGAKSLPGFWRGEFRKMTLKSISIISRLYNDYSKLLINVLRYKLQKEIFNLQNDLLDVESTVDNEVKCSRGIYCWFFPTRLASRTESQPQLTVVLLT
jgi:hypothetical protein